MNRPEFLTSLGGCSQGRISGVEVIIHSARFSQFILIQGVGINRINLGAMNDDLYTAWLLPLKILGKSCLGLQTASKPAASVK
ncbi:MAG TPA: hypothetical protein VH593_14825 [Ktedonobacteraceae bacterium]